MKFYAVLVMPLVLFSGGCGVVTTSTPTLYSLDGVKLISKDISHGDDSSTFSQQTYKINSGRRLLLRFEKLQNNVNEVDVTPGKKVQMQIALSSADQVPAAIQSFQLCPVTRPWMMLATWQYAHPFGAEGNWGTAGGDFDAPSCVKGAEPAPTPSPTPTPAAKKEVKDKIKDQGSVKDTTPNTLLLFDVTAWFVSYPKGRMQDNGLLLMSDQEMTIAGDQSGNFSPRILYDKVGTTTWSGR